MSFFDPLHRCYISATCRQLRHHDMARKGPADDLFFDRKKGDKLFRDYYRGTVEYCQRAGCKLSHFTGEKLPWKTVIVIDGQENPLESDIR